MVKKHGVKFSPSLWRLALLALLLLSSVCIVYGQGYEEWSKDIGGDDTEHFKAIHETFDGGFIVAGYVEPFTRDDHDLYIVKTDSMGNLEWSKVYGDTKDDDAYDVVQAGAAGITFGRNIWQSDAPATIIRALKHILHENGSVDEALDLMAE